MKYSKIVRAKALSLFELGFAEKAVSTSIDVPEGTVKRWLYTYRALGKEALFVTEHRKYSHETKVKAARAVTEGRMTKLEAMTSFGVKSKSQINTWCKLYREGGADALLPKPKGRPKATPRTFATREEELEARVQELELELEIQKRINALADGIERKWQTR